MAKDLNKVLLIGRLGKDPEMKYTDKGIAYTSFSLATGSTYKDANGNDVDATEWHNIIVWRKLAEICGQYLRKGSRIYCEGRLKTSSSEKDGSKRYFTNIEMTDMIMLDSKGSNINVNEATDSEKDSAQEDDDLPF